MNLFNLKNKCNVGVSEETTKAYWEWKKNERLSWPTKKEAIKAIVGAIPESQLKKLEVHCPNGKIITFEEQLSLNYEGLYPIWKLETISSTIKNSLNENQYLFDLPNPRIIYIFIKDICDSFFRKNI